MGWKCVMLSFSRNHIDAIIENSRESKWRFTGIYGFPEIGRKRDTWNLLRMLASYSDLPWCMGGDFNCMMYWNEKCSGGCVANSVLQGFRDMVSECSLFDTRSEGFFFTWNRGGIREKLNRVLANDEWFLLFPNCRVEIMASGSSDHHPIVIYIVAGRESVRKKHKFYFEDSWKRNLSCREVIRSNWNNSHGTNPILDLGTSIVGCSSALREWDLKENGKVEERLVECRARLCAWKTAQELKV